MASDLGYDLTEPTGWRKLAARILAARLMSRLNRRVLAPLDRRVQRLTNGKTTFSAMGGFPPLWLTVNGARTGSPRTVPLLGIPIGEDLALIGSSFGQEKTPAWVHNLRANADAVVACGDRQVEVRARPATPTEAELVWRKASAIYPGYGYYADRASNCRIRVFVLEGGGKMKRIDSGPTRVGS